MTRLHLRAAFAWGVVASLLSALAWVQLVDPRLIGGAPWLGAGRLRFASGLAMLLGWNINLAAAVLYAIVPALDSLVRRWRVTGLKMAGWNLVIVMPAVLIALAGIDPPASIHTIWASLAVPQPQVTALGLMMALVFTQTIDPSVWRDGRRMAVILGVVTFLVFTVLPPLDAASQLRAIANGRPFIDGLAGRLPFWTGMLVATLALGWVSALFAARPPLAAGAPVRMTGLAKVASALFLVALVLQTIAAGAAQVTGDAGPPPTAAEARGRAVFVREGCASCHDMPWRAGIGPTLFEESGARPTDWHFTHLFDPRSVQVRSVMPSYAHLFSGAPVAPSQAARDLVAFLDSLGRANLALPESAVLAAHKTRARHPVANDPAPALAYAGDLDAAKKEFAVQCMGCHGPEGQGDGRAADGLRPRPANLAAHRYTPEQVASVLWNGVPGTAMPAWRDQPVERLAALSAAARSFGEAAASHGATAPAPSAETLAMGAKVFAANCSQCHGETGGGDGFSASRLGVPPANFQRQQPTLEYALRAIAGGVEGTPMAPWTSRINEQELLAVAHYVRSLYAGGTR